ncbi:MAG: hypothetical protein ACOY0T_12035 [Myxococcota bacterium]
MQASDIVRDATAKYFKAARSAVFVEDDIHEARFPWSKTCSFWIGTNMERYRVLLVLDALHAAHVFRPVSELAHVSQAQSNITLLNSIMQAEGVKLPHGLELAWTLRNALASFGGDVASRRFFEDQKQSLAMWTTYRPQDGAQLFEHYCTDPVLQTHEGAWQLSFRYFNSLGGVEEWSAAGKLSGLTPTRLVNCFPIAPSFRRTASASARW